MNDVPSWLEHLGLSQYERHFMDGGFDDIEFLNDLTLEDLVAIGITKVGHQRKILLAAPRLQQREIPNPVPTIRVVGDEIQELKEDFEVSQGVDGSVGDDFQADDGSTADENVGEYAAPEISHYNEIHPGKSGSATDLPDEIRWAEGEDQNRNPTQTGRESIDVDCQEAEPVILALKKTSEEVAEKDTNIEFPVDKSTVMNGASHDEDNVDGVKELAASFQHTIHVETQKAKGVPPPVKPKSFKKAPPPAVAPKPKANGHRVEKIEVSPTDVNSTVDFTNVIKEAEALSESGSESPPSTLGRHKSESGVSLEGSLKTTTSGSQGSLNSESEDLQREIIQSLHHTKPRATSVEDINKQLAQTLSFSPEDLIEQQKQDEEFEKYQSEQNKSDMLFTDIQGMLDNLSSELDDMFK